MSRPRRPDALPLRDGVSASCAVVHGGPWASVLDFLCERLPVLPRAQWAARLAAGDVLNADGTPVDAECPPTEGQRVFYYRQLDTEPDAPEDAQVLYQDEGLVVADKPHFMPVTPSGQFIQRSLLVRLKRALALPNLSPVHRIDRETAGLVVFAIKPNTRDAYQALFRDRRVDKLYEAVAPDLPRLTAPLTHTSRLERDPDHFFLSREVPGAPNSRSHIERAAALAGGNALYHLRPVTGQRHQLRLHLLALGAPIVGDAFYPTVLRGPGEPDDLAQPLQLLARELAFDDPVTGQRRVFRSARRLQAAVPASA